MGSPSQISAVAAADGVPFFRHAAAGHGAAEAFERWRSLIAPTYDVRPVDASRRLPHGQALIFQIGGMFVHRLLYAPQSVRRTARLAAEAADTITLQYWRSGGYQGTIAHQRLAVTPGTAVLIGSRVPVDGTTTHTDVCGIVVPRAIFHGLPIEAYGASLDEPRNRLLVARLASLYRAMPQTSAAALPALRHDLVAFLRRLFDPSVASDVLEGQDLDSGLRALAQSVIREQIACPDLDAETIAARLRISRATLYRLFAPEDGVMRVVQAERLMAIRDALADPLERRSLARLASAYAISSPSQFSRSFRKQFGASPREWRATRQRVAATQSESDARTLWRWFRERPGGSL